LAGERREIQIQTLAPTMDKPTLKHQTATRRLNDDHYGLMELELLLLSILTMLIRDHSDLVQHFLGYVADIIIDRHGFTNYDPSTLYPQPRIFTRGSRLWPWAMHLHMPFG
jgi:hypothetical protein